jgi:hypothetical protein
LTLAPIGSPGATYPLMARINVGKDMFYVVEYRSPVRFDRGGPSAAVVIREYDGNVTGVVQRSTGGTDWRVGEQFTDLNNLISVSVDQLDLGFAVITVTH